VERKELIDALSALPEAEAQSVVAEARAQDREQRKQAAADALKRYLRPSPPAEPDEPARPEVSRHRSRNPEDWVPQTTPATTNEVNCVQAEHNSSSVDTEEK
jgi:hypothetical protein